MASSADAGRKPVPTGEGVRPAVPDPVQAVAEHRGAPGDRLTEQGDSRAFVLQVVQPALAGLMDGSVSTLAPLFATAFATHRPHTALVVGVAAAIGAAISMAFAEGLSDNGVLTGRGSPLLRGMVIGLATFVGGIGHALPFLLSNLQAALLLAYLIVGLELLAIAGIRNRYFGTPLWLSAVQVIVGGLLVFGAGVAIGSQGATG
jgi:VIT1/CCC1 family predicted Fe2+/Mn2+ transporter